jgi:hypothetical protein
MNIGGGYVYVVLKGGTEMKRIFSFLLVLCMLAVLLPAGVLTARAADEGVTGECSWRLENGVLTISGKGAMAHYRGESAPWEGRVNQVIVEEGVTAIGDSAFVNCGAMTDITLPSSLRSIGHFAFWYCRSLKTITFPEGLQQIGNDLFMGCLGLEEVFLPASLALIGSDNFTGGEALQGIYVHEDNPAYSSDDGGVLYNRAKTTLYAYPAAKRDVAYIVPGTVERIESRAFSFAHHLRTVTLPDSVNYIGGMAFTFCGALEEAKKASTDGGAYIGNHLVDMVDTACQSYTVRQGTVTVAGNALEGLYGLREVVFPEGLVTIGDQALSGLSALQSITLPRSLKNIGKFAFFNTSALKNVYYRGTAAQKSKISIGQYNDALTGTKWHMEACVQSAEHAWVEDIHSHPDCTESGTMTRSCTICHDEQEVLLPATGHTFDAWTRVSDPGCVQTGLEVRACAICGYTEQKTLKALGHALGDWSVVSAPTCTTAGTERRGCSRCKYTEERDITATGHVMGEFVQSVEPTCAAVGEERSCCKNCDHAEHRVLPMTEHVFGAWGIETASGCTTDGVQKRMCTLCGREEAQSMAPMGHAYGEYTVTLEPTHKSEGREESVCVNCGDVQSRTLPPKETDALLIVGVAAVALVLIGAVVTMCVVLNKRKGRSEA